MAKLGFPFHHLIFILIIALNSERVPSTPTIVSTSTLNVTHSIHTTLNLFTLSPHTSLTKTTDVATSDTLSLSIHPRATVHKSSHKDYESVIKDRLNRDSLRVSSILTRVNLAVNGVKETNLIPLNDEVSLTDLSDVDDLQVPVTSGSTQGSGEYFGRVGIGNPPSQFYMALDTGSDVIWLQCAPCTRCYKQTDPIFEPAKSSSYTPITCDARDCKNLDLSRCRNGTCIYQVSYGDGSFTFGNLASETVTLDSYKTVSDVAIGCGHNNEGLFVGSAGLLGLGGGPLSFPSQINATSFSYCFVDRDSDETSPLEFNLPLALDAVKAPLIRNNKDVTSYYIGLKGLSVGGKMLNIPLTTFELADDGNGGVIVDSGTTITRLAKEGYDILRDAFVNGTKEGLTRVDGVALFDTCYDLSKKKSVRVPTVGFVFTNGEKLNLPAKNYLIPVDSVGTYCFAFAPTSSRSSLSIIGNVQQQGIRVGYDLGNKLIGFSPNKC